LKKKVLVAPLDWGLGHATRCVPVIQALLVNGFEVVIATSGSALPLLKLEFPRLSFFELPSYNASYSNRIFFMAKIFLQTPQFLRVINKEHTLIEEIVKAERIDAVISDNRFGCYSEKVRSIFITHQVTILMPSYLKWLQGFVNFFNHRMIRRFAECWVPDFAIDRITEKLTESGNLKVTFIGMLSRFQKSVQPVAHNYDLLVLLSGPEPQRSVFEKIVLQQLPQANLKVLLVRGLPGDEAMLPKSESQLTTVNHLPSSALQQAIEASKLVLSRSGYTTVMDLYFLEKKAIFVPTPGQTEQEYLGEQLQQRRVAYCAKQENFDLKKALHEAKFYHGFQIREANMLQAAINHLC
jgi:uncharacterized protein (TIGR00661 family)